MRLERLEITGFKSFGDRAELAFDQGVTAIVGPNGCGKSNVADAITWVLGEQSAKSLRGEKMEDVIFGGSDARKPGAAAEVRLRLSGLMTSVIHDGPGANGRIAPANGNTNGNGHHPPDGVSSPVAVPQAAAEDIASLVEQFTRDVEVTRRLYRSGESEYLIDGEVCRLRDVHELLMDTGLGAKAYAIIEQGKIGMILSSRPADRRQLIEEAAGITKYKSRRRAAELKLEAAQQNLTRIDDIVFEVEKQRGTLKRQAAKARRYQKLRDELRRWEKVLFARRYRELAATIEQTRKALAAAREREAAAFSRLAEVETHLTCLRNELAEADTRAAGIRERAHTVELAINRRQQQVEYNREQAGALAGRSREVSQEIEALEGRREPARIEIETRRQALGEAERARDEAEAVRAAAADDHARAQQQIEGLESDVERARSEVFRAANAATALRHATQHAAVQYERVGETLAKLDVEADEQRREAAKAEADRDTASDALDTARARQASVMADRGMREAALTDARAEHERRAREIRNREQELAAVEARLASLEELAASRAEYGDAARMVLVQANGHVGQQGAIADYLEVDSRYERAVEACLGELLQHVIVERHEQAAAGLSLVREHDAGRCGFVVIDPGSNGYHPREALRMPGILPVGDVLRVSGPHATTIQKVLPDAYVADSFEQAVEFARTTAAVVATVDGDVLRGRHLVSGGAKAESRGILATRREIKELRERIAADRGALGEAAADLERLTATIGETTAAVAALGEEQHRLAIAIVGHEGQLARAQEDVARLARKAAIIAQERRAAEEERASLEARREETEASIGRTEEAQRIGEEQLADAQRRLADVRESVSSLAAHAAEVRAVHAGLVERTSALAVEVTRLEEAARELEARIGSRRSELAATQARREALVQAIAEGERALEDDIRTIDELRSHLRTADDEAAALRAKTESQEDDIRQARVHLEAVRSEVAELDLARATVESDLSHLAQSCLDTVQASLDEVLAAVEQMEQAGETTPDAAAITAEEPDPDSDEPATVAAPSEVEEAAAASMSAEEAIVALKGRIDRLGPVNMMAIEQFDDLETRHVFLTTQRRDLVESIAQTSEAIKRIDETTRARFTEAFAAIQANFQVTFSTLFGGGHAGLTLLDENDPLESGIEIVASPPGKRLQSVQLLSGGEKALTAIALMFAIFKYKPSPFCLLDEIDAPLDDANVGRFVEMLRGMLNRTQFILITHNRRTMEIANRLYGVTMEEPGVSKLISVNLN
jgi:chromosome segregation protein